jgi:hypothetical protein
VVSPIIDFWKGAAWKRSQRCQHGVLGDCPSCLEVAKSGARVRASAWAEGEARRLQDLDEEFFAIDERTRTKIIEVLEDHWVDAALPDWTAMQMKQTVVKVYNQSLANEGKLMEVSGASVKRAKAQYVLGDRGPILGSDNESDC